MRLRIRPRGVAGQRILWWASTATLAFTASAVSAAIDPQRFRVLAAAVALALFGAGTVLFLVAFMKAVARSRFEQISVAGLYFLAGCAPASVRRHLLGAVGVQTAVALATASVRPFTSLAFGVLVPMFGLALAGLWGAYHGVFPARDDPRASLAVDE